jgi:hypothetical protein
VEQESVPDVRDAERGLEPIARFVDLFVCELEHCIQDEMRDGWIV